jgi:aspartate aminotransferase
MSSEIRLADRLSRVQPSITLAVTARAEELNAAGVDVVSFGAGEPDFDLPDHIKSAVRTALETPAVSKYTNVRGTLALRQAIASDLSRAHGVELRPDQVIVNVGAKHSFFNLFMALLNAGDEVIIPAPYWVSYPDMVKLAGGEPVIVPTRAENGFALEAGALAAAITPRTRALVLNNPSNPTGAVYRREKLAALAEVIEKTRILVLSDDIYRHLVYGDARWHSIAACSREVAARTVFIDGVSKAYAMTGWRIGYAAGPKPLIDAMAKIQGQSTSNPAHIAQYAAMVALTGPQECVAEMRAAFNKRRQTMLGLLRAIPGVRCVEPEGAFYAFPDLSAFLGRRTPAGVRIEDDVALTNYLLDEAKVAVVPGSGFGAPGFVRLSYACGVETIQRGLAWLAEGLGRLKES